jgi:hypothetical protein
VIRDDPIAVLVERAPDDVALSRADADDDPLWRVTPVGHDSAQVQVET